MLIVRGSSIELGVKNKAALLGQPFIGSYFIESWITLHNGMRPGALVLALPKVGRSLHNLLSQPDSAGGNGSLRGDLKDWGHLPLGWSDLDSNPGPVSVWQTSVLLYKGGGGC